MAENLSNSKEQQILDNEIALMRYIISQCNEETLISGGQVGKRHQMTFHYRLPSGLHVYSDRPFNFQNIYKRNINIQESGNHIYITSEPVEELEYNKKSGRYNSLARETIDLQNIPFIYYRESPNIDFSYQMDNRYFDKHERIKITKSAISIHSDLHPNSEYPIRGGLLIEGRDEYSIKQDEFRGYVQGSQYFSDIFQKIIQQNSKYNIIEMSSFSYSIRPLFEMLAIEKQRLQEIGSNRTEDEHSETQVDERMTEIQTAIEGIKKLKLTQEEISYLENVLQELRENNASQSNGVPKSYPNGRGD